MAHLIKKLEKADKTVLTPELTEESDQETDTSTTPSPNMTTLQTDISTDIVIEKKMNNASRPIKY